MAYNCDLCLGRLEKGKAPECVEYCTCGAIRHGDFKENEEKNLYKIGDNIIVHSVHWERK